MYRLLSFLLLLLSNVSSARDWNFPLLKKGLISHVSKLARSVLNGQTRVELSISRDHNIVLELKPNIDLLSPNYQEIEILPNGTKHVLRTAEQMRMCWFRGKVVGDPESEVVVSDCDGYFDGVIKTGDGKNHIAQAGESDDDVSIYNSEDQEEYHGACGVHEHATEHATPHAVEEVPGARRLLEYSTAVNVVEVALVSDNSYLRARGGPYGRNLTAVGQLNVQLMNIVQATYQAASFVKPTSIRLKAQYFLSGVSDPYSITKDANGEVDENVLLDAFTSFTRTLPKYDSVHLLTYYDLQADTVGFAHTASVCSNSNTAISMGSNTPQRVANTIAHELGHVLGMVHDGDTNCPSTGYLMSSTNSCPSQGLCPFSSCSVSAKDTFTATRSCLFNWTESTCYDGVWNGDETGIDCGGSCLACSGQKGCLVNRGGCQQTCTPVGQTGFVCGCDSTSYVDPVNGLRCIQDVNQCLSNSPCSDTCTNLLGPGGVYRSFTCGCTSPNVLSAIDGVTCAPPSCYDRVKNQNEVLTDCGGVCPRACGCLVSNGTWQYNYDRGFSIAGAQWRSSPSSLLQYELLKYGVPIRYVYRIGSNQWVYDDDNVSSGYYGAVYSTASMPPSSNQWQIYTGVSTTFARNAFSFVACSSVASVCGNGKVEGGEICDSCLVYAGGVCVKPNPCCDSTCLAPRPRGFSCNDQNNLPGACWEGNCITRGAACDVVTTLSCFGNPCVSATGGGECGVIEPAFTSSSCDAPISCYVDCVQTNLNSDPPIGAIRGFPCSAMDANGVYPSVCSGGPQGNGKGSVCMSVIALSEFLTPAPTRAPTTPFPTLPTRSPVTQSPTLPTTSRPTRAPTAPTSHPTSGPTTPTASVSGAAMLHISAMCLAFFCIL